MSASDHMGDQFITLYRGLRGVSHPDEIDPELIGPHWTHSPEVAEDFAGKHGSIVTAQVPSKHIMYNGRTGEQHPDFHGNYHNDFSALYRVMPEEQQEKETFVRPGVPVRIVSMRTHPENPIRDKWSFEEPVVRNSEKLYGYTAEKGADDWAGDIVEWYKGES